MKLLFATDHRFEVAPDGEVFTLGGKYPYHLWTRNYLDVFDEMVVVGRGGEMVSPPGRLSTSSGPNVRHRLLGSLRGAKRIFEVSGHAKVVDEEVAKADVVIARLPSELGMMACESARRRGKPYLIEVVASAWDGLWNHGSLAARAYAPVLERRTAAAAAKAPLALYVTQSFLQAAYPSRGQTWAVSDVALEPVSDATIQRRMARVARGEAPLTFGTIGSLVSRMKGVHVALTALGQVKDRLPPFVYRVLGEGDPSPYVAMARSLGLEGHVAFDGVLPGGGPVAEWLDGVDIYLQPSFQEGLPRALIEALSRGCRAAASTVGGNPELLPADRLHRPGDAAGLASTLLAMAGQDEAAAALESQGSFETAGRYQAQHLAVRRRAAFEALRKMGENHA